MLDTVILVPGRHFADAVSVAGCRRRAGSPLDLPEQFDVLDAYWRLSFGKELRLLGLTTVTRPADSS
jgi:hypothetical protein